ncbi:rhomboid family intramembrane serine protease [Parvibaculum sedimenti]|uniref:Rhomboid family intramembrane serine protease n=1 Tax=Parvibaculum sedimenti TaxID=2608632 RepID=A0A6N6VIM8_9HYPH|nr:rhomboid family intramembrane serine protease [Parvibaculum sedimenti]KAB7741136.1 rhomboid family intramembrane serine protease [Parvibaculum sedimenti]
MFPISDDNPEPGRPLVTWAIIAVCIAVFLWEMSLPADEADRALLQFGAIPAALFGSMAVGAVPVWATIFTSMFMHASLGHVGGNMLYLWIFGDNVELAMGRVRFLVFYLVCGAAAALAQALQAPESIIPLVGASGAISGVLGSYLLIHPFGRVRVLIMPLPFFVRVVTVPSLVVLGFWFIIQFLSGLSSDGAKGGVAFWAHVGGFIAGMVLAPIFKRRDVPLLQRGTPRIFDARRGDERRDGGEGPRRGPWS